jgi:hypothetical protein
MDKRAALLRAHQMNIHRYQSLLKTKLSEAEANFVERRVSEERFALAMLGFMSPSATSKGWDLVERWNSNPSGRCGRPVEFPVLAPRFPCFLQAFSLFHFVGKCSNSHCRTEPGFLRISLRLQTRSYAN